MTPEEAADVLRLAEVAEEKAAADLADIRREIHLYLDSVMPTLLGLTVKADEARAELERCAAATVDAHRGAKGEAPTEPVEYAPPKLVQWTTDPDTEGA